MSREFVWCVKTLMSTMCDDHSTVNFVTFGAMHDVVLCVLA